MRESEVSQKALLAASAMGATLFRNSVGMAQLSNGAYIQFGLCPGSADYIGWFPRKITQDMVGQTVAVFTAIEMKAPGQKPRPNQQQFLSNVTADGGIGFVCDNPDNIKEHLS